MVAGFTLPSLPSLPSLQLPAVLDFLDTSPQVFYPPSRPSSRTQAVTATGGPSASSSASCPSSPSPRRRQRPLSMGDARVLFAQAGPLPPFSPSAHPHIDSPLDSSRDHRPPSEPTSPLLGHSTWRSLPPRPTRQDSGGGHRRSQSMAPSPSTSAPLQQLQQQQRPPAPSRSLLDSRNSLASASCASLPTLNEDAERGGAGSSLAPTPFPLALDRRSSWLEPSVSINRTQSLHTHDLKRERRQSTASMVTIGGGSAATSGAPPSRSHRSSISFSSRARSRNGSISSISAGFGPLERAGSPSPTVVQPSTSISELAVLATWAPEPLSSAPASGRSSSSSAQSSVSRSNSSTTPSESLRARLRTLSQLTGGSSVDPPRSRTTSVNSISTPTNSSSSSTRLQSPKLGATMSPPATPRSTCGTPGHGTPMGPPGAGCRAETPGSCTPTTSSHGAHAVGPPQSPTPTRRQRASYLSHKHTSSFPDSLALIAEPQHAQHAHAQPAPPALTSRPTTSRLRQPPQLHMAVAADVPPRSRRSSLATTVTSPILVSSPGSLVSDSGSATDTSGGSPTTSVESLTLELEPAFALLALREQCNHHREVPLALVPERPVRHPDRPRAPAPGAQSTARANAPRPSLPERKHSNDAAAYLTTSIRSRRGSSMSISSHRERRDSFQSVHATVPHALAPAHQYPHHIVTAPSSRRESLKASSNHHKQFPSQFPTQSQHSSHLQFPPHHYHHHPTHGTRVGVPAPVAVQDTEERFLDFDDI